MEIRRVTVDDGARLREVRLAALRDAPDAFASTYGEAFTYPPSLWAGRADDASRGSVAATFLLVDGQDTLGMITGLRDAEDDQTARLVSLWVAPEARGMGQGRRLVEEVVEWAREPGSTCLRLWVTNDNESGNVLYESVGFRPTGNEQPLPSNPGLMERQMELLL